MIRKSVRRFSEKIMLNQKRPANSNQILLADDLAEAVVVADELFDEFMQATLEDVVHVAVLEAVADAAGMALRRPLPAIGDADLVEVADEVLIAASQRARQRVVEDQEVGD